MTALRKKLTLKQEGFVKDYLETKNASEAIRRNYDVKDATPNTVHQMARENLTKPTVLQALEEMKERYALDSYAVYQAQKQIFNRVSGGRDLKLANDIANKIQDRAGLAPINKSESKSLKANFVITRGVEANDASNSNIRAHSAPPVTDDHQ